MKRWGLALIALVAVVTVVALVGCSSGGPKVGAKATMEEALTAFKAGDLNKFGSFLEGSADGQLADEVVGSLDIDPELANRFISAWCQSVEFNVVSAEESGNSATAKVEIAAVNFMKLMEQQQEQIIADLTSNPSAYAGLSDEELEEKITTLVFEEVIKAFGSAERELPQTEIIILAVDKSGAEPKWVIVGDNLITALFPGML